MIHFLPFGNYRTLMCVLFPDVFLLKNMTRKKERNSEYDKLGIKIRVES